MRRSTQERRDPHLPTASPFRWPPSRVRPGPASPAILALTLLASWFFPLPLPAAQPSGAPPPAQEYPLDLPADFSPVLCGENLFLFSSGGRNQTMRPGEVAPGCNVIQIFPALQPVCAGGGPWVLDKEGALWRFGDGPAVPVEQGLSGARAIVALPGGKVAVLLGKALWLAGGNTVDLPFEADGMEVLEDGGYWIHGAGAGARLDGDGKVLWNWRPSSLNPGPAALGRGFVLVGTREGYLVALSAGSGRERFRYRAGGEISSAPLVRGATVIFASRDHFVRCLRYPSGQLQWQVRLEGRPDFGPSGVPGGILVAAADASRIWLLSDGEGRRLWAWKAPKGTVQQSPAWGSGEIAVLAWTEESNPTLYRVPMPKLAPPPVEKRR